MVVGLSHFLPGGGADESSSEAERVYVVLEGHITVTTEDGDSSFFGSILRRSARGRAASRIFPFAVQCAGKVVPTSVMARSP